MGRDFTAGLKKEVRRGSAVAATHLLDRSIHFRHEKLAVYRYLVAAALGAELSDEHHFYSRRIAMSMTQDGIAALLIQARRFLEDNNLKCESGFGNHSAVHLGLTPD